MIVHMTSIRVALGEIDNLRAMVAEKYLPLIREQSGFVRDYFLEQVDDSEHVQLIVVWENQSALEKFRSSEAGECINRELRNSGRLRVLSIQSQSYIVRVKPSEGLSTGRTLVMPCVAQSGS